MVGSLCVYGSGSIITGKNYTKFLPLAAGTIPGHACPYFPHLGSIPILLSVGSIQRNYDRNHITFQLEPDSSSIKNLCGMQSPFSIKSYLTFKISLPWIRCELLPNPYLPEREDVIIVMCHRCDACSGIVHRNLCLIWVSIYRHAV